MSLINCPECNREISDRAGACPHCGFPINAKNAETVSYTTHASMSNSTFSQNQLQAPQYNNNIPKPQNSPLGILALILSILGCTFIVGIILAIIDLRKKDDYKKTCSIVALCICCFWLFIGIISSSNDDGVSPEETPISTTQTIEMEEIEAKTDSSDNQTEVFPDKEKDNDKEATASEKESDSIQDAFKQGFEDNFHISEENQKNIDSIKETTSEIVNDEDVQEAYENWKDSLKAVFGIDE